MPGGGRAVKTGRTRPWPMPLGSRDGMSKAPAIYCRGRADGVRGDEATYLSMTVRHGHSRRARRPLATASLFSAAPPRPDAGKNAMVLLEPPPYRVPQPSRPGQPAARVGPFQLSSPAPASTRKKVVATASRREGACNRAGEPSEPFFGEEPRRNEQGPGNLLPGPSGWSPRRRSYLSFHDCAAWSRRVGP